MRSCSVAMSVIDIVWRRNKATTNYVPTIEYPTESDATNDNSNMDGEESDGFSVVTTDKSGLPVIWTWDVLLSAFLDCGMHMIFHGVVTDVIEMADDFMKDHKLASEFIRLVTPYMNDIRTLRLDWCPMKLLPKKQWIAEDELGFARVLPFLYGQFFFNLA